VVVKDGLVVGRGWTQPGGRPHAETQALDRAGAAARGATLYTTLEPCSHVGKTPPCADAVAAAGIARVVSALADPNPDVAGAGHWRMAEAGIVVEVGLGADEARRAHAGHIRRMLDRRPHVTVKLAVSADEKVALAGRKPVKLTGEAADARVHRLRAMNDAVATGIGTVLADDPLLTCRLPGVHSPVRVVLDSTLRLPLTSRLYASARQVPLWVIAEEHSRQDLPQGSERALRAGGVEVMRGPGAGGRLELQALLEVLATRGITRLMIEAGPILTTAFLRANFIDELVLLRAPARIGPDGVDALDGLPLSALTHAPGLEQVAAETVGADRVEMFERS
jgi:diaminohydroxyphosphoribosylaminopyrimidine deaminase/5-amino-6-(5-phosphoribosylamino)uracil reductase